MTTLVPSFVKGPASFLQVTRTTIRAWMTLDFCQSQHMTTELATRVRLKKQCFHVFSVAELQMDIQCQRNFAIIFFHT